MIRKLKSGQYRIYSRKVDPETKKRKNLGTFDSKEAAQKHEKEIQYFKHHWWWGSSLALPHHQKLDFRLTADLAAHEQEISQREAAGRGGQQTAHLWPYDHEAFLERQWRWYGTSHLLHRYRAQAAHRRHEQSGNGIGIKLVGGDAL